MPLNYDALNKKKNQRYGSNWKPSPGDNEVRVLPPTSDYFSELINFIAYEYRNHFVRMEGHDIQVFRCLRDFDAKCPACMFYYDHKDSNDSGVAEIAKKFNPSTRYLFNILDLDDAEAGIQTYESGPTVHNEFLKYIANENWGDVLDAEEGRNFTVTLTPANESKTGFNSYDVMIAPNQTSVLHHLPEGWKEELDGLETEVPERPSDSKVNGILSTAKERAFGTAGNDTPAPGSDSPEPEPEPQPQQSSGFSADVSAPTGDQSQDSAPENVNTESGEITEEDGSDTLPPRAEGGPRIDPETDNPVCFGNFDRSKYPCDNCPDIQECQVEKLGLNT